MFTPGERAKGFRINVAFTDARQAHRQKTQSKLPLLLPVNLDLDSGKLFFERLPCLQTLRKCAEHQTPCT
jgi:hypothetical protein